MWLRYFMKKIIEKIKSWWSGEDIFHENKPSDPVIFIGWNNSKHWTSSLAHWIVSLFTNPERRATFLAVLGFITFAFMLLKYFSDTNSNKNTTNPERKSGEPVAEIVNQINQDQGSNIKNNSKPKESNVL